MTSLHKHEMDWTPALTALAERLAALFPAMEDALRLTTVAGIPISRVRQVPTPINLWHSILQQALVRRRVPAILEAVRAEGFDLAAAYAEDGDAVAAPGATATCPPARLHCIFADEDRDALERLLRQLRALGSQVCTWHRDLVLGGQDRAEAIRAALATADLILLLVSADLLASVAALQELDRAGGPVIAIAVRQIDRAAWAFRPWLWLPEGGQAIAALADGDGAWAGVIRGVRLALVDGAPGREGGRGAPR